MNEISTWIGNWFKEKKGIIEDSDFYTRNYFEAGFIDSFGVVELIMDIEAEFGIRFSQDHFQDRRFATINGLAEIIGELK